MTDQPIIKVTFWDAGLLANLHELGYYDHVSTMHNFGQLLCNTLLQAYPTAHVEIIPGDRYDIHLSNIEPRAATSRAILKIVHDVYMSRSWLVESHVFDDMHAGMDRIEDTPELRPYWRIFTDDEWNIERTDWHFVATAPLEDVLAWAQRINDYRQTHGKVDADERAQHEWETYEREHPNEDDD
jgi:hypothetical protein